MTDCCEILNQPTCVSSRQTCTVCSFNPKPVMVQKSWCQGFSSVLGGRTEADEFAFHYCCNVMTGLMRSTESWASHIVVSPIHPPAQEIHCGIVLRHIHSDGWMLLLMFQTTEHHSEPFLWFTYKHTGALWWQRFSYSHVLHRKRNSCLPPSVFTVHEECKLCFSQIHVIHHLCIHSFSSKW